MAYSKVYTRINWVDRETAKSTSLGATNLNKMDYAVNELDNRVVELETIKADRNTVNNMVKDWTMDRSTGIITVIKQNGEKILFDLNIEKIPVSFALSPDGILTMTTADGTAFTADIGAMVPVLTLNSSEEIGVNVEGSGVAKTYSFFIKEGSITGDKLVPDYLADTRSAMDTAQTYAESANRDRTAAERSADRAEQAWERIEEAVGTNIPGFALNLETGHMEYTGGRFDFAMNTDTGHLEWEVTV